MIESDTKDKSLNPGYGDAACSIRGARDAPKFKDYILPLIFTKRLCDVFDDEVNRIASEVGSRKKPSISPGLTTSLSVSTSPLYRRTLSNPYGLSSASSPIERESVTTHMRAIARENPLLQGIIDRVDFNATTHGQRDLDDDRLSNLIEAISTSVLGLRT